MVIAEASVSEHCFLPMPHGEDRYRVRIKAVANHISGVCEINEPFAVLLGQILDQAAHMRMQAEGSDTCEDRFPRSPGCQRVFRCREIPRPLKIADRCRREHSIWRRAGQI